MTNDANDEIAAQGITYKVENPDNLDPGLVFRALDEVKGEYAALEDWLMTTAGGFSTTNFGGIDAWGTSGLGGGSAYNADLQQRADFFNRNEYRAPRNIMDEFRLSYDLMARDDIVSGVCDLTEGLAIDRVKWEVESIEEEDIWDQIGQDLDIEIRLREMWRELFGMSQFYVAMFWGKKTYKVRGKTKKDVKRRKTYSLNVPLSISLLDPTKVLPVGNLMFGKERLAWIASVSEINGWGAGDAVLKQLFEKPYVPTQEEKQLFGKMGVDFEHLMLLKEENVWRHTLSRPAYKRWSDVRMKSIFQLADLKANLRQMERAHIVGATNFILVVRKGTDKLPARQQEIDNLEGNVRKLARVPLLIGDHRLSVEIVTPAQDHTLDDKKWDTLDSRIGNRLMLTLGGTDDGPKRDTSVTAARAIARGIESRRAALGRSIEKNIVQKIMEKNPEMLETKPHFAYSPKHVALDWDPAFAALLIQLRDRGDLSRETILEEANFSQEIEARRREYEEEFYDKIFNTAVPFDSPGNNSQPGGPGNPAGPNGAKPKTSGGADNKSTGKPSGKPALPKAKTSTPSAKLTIHVKGDKSEEEGELDGEIEE